ncbi:NAD(P)H-hydrate dehydratase [Parvularcula oceani]|uniref:NAD(P)H-hydrate dehydratase n=1 Tax=Parvularcula oceani TaxID=1247963 RepID=UPI0004E13BE9|nr:NAD(P)H-hydrate dehydratase [Parvularcula oceani]
MRAIFEPNRSANVLLPQSMAAVDAAAISAGADGYALMRRAGGACVRVIRGRFSRRPVSILCGPGQNGGDGWVIAEALRQAGWPVRVHSLVQVDALAGAARQAAERAMIAPEPLEALEVEEAGLVVDALFGTGLTRDLEGAARAVIERVAATDLPVIAVDMPSGVDGATGEIRGAAAQVVLTVTFHMAKPGQLLWPGAGMCGDLLVADIGLAGGAPDALRNGPELWTLPRPEAPTHKYERGHVVIFGGGPHSGGAARLSAHAAARAGAGAVTLAAPEEALGVYANHLDAIMVRDSGAPAKAGALVRNAKAKAAVIGPGAGRTDETRSRVLALLAQKTALVLDADALTVFEDTPDTLFAALSPETVLTPHEGEFSRLFGDIAGDKLTRCKAAAERAGATVLLKGPDTVIAAPGEVPVISDHSTPWLATAGAGDVLAGVIAALLAQGLPAREAAAAGAYIHGEAGRRGGAGLTADVLPGLVAEAYRDLLPAG